MGFGCPSGSSCTVTGLMLQAVTMETTAADVCVPVPSVYIGGPLCVCVCVCMHPL